MVILASCSNLIQKSTDEALTRANAQVIAVGINTHNVLHPESLIDENNFNSETIIDTLKEDELWPDDGPKGEDLQSALDLIYFEDGQACVAEG